MHTDPETLKRFCQWFARPTVGHIAWCEGFRRSYQATPPKDRIRLMIDQYIGWMTIAQHIVPPDLLGKTIDPRDIDEMVENCFKSIMRAKNA